MTNRPRKGRGHMNHFSGTAAARPTIVKCCIQVGYIKSQHMHGKLPLKGARSGSRDTFSVSTSAIISLSGTAEARVVKFFTHVEYIKRYSWCDRLAITEKSFVN